MGKNKGTTEITESKQSMKLLNIPLAEVVVKLFCWTALFVFLSFVHRKSHRANVFCGWSKVRVMGSSNNTLGTMDSWYFVEVNAEKCHYFRSTIQGEHLSACMDDFVKGEDYIS